MVRRNLSLLWDHMVQRTSTSADVIPVAALKHFLVRCLSRCFSMTHDALECTIRKGTRVTNHYSISPKCIWLFNKEKEQSVLNRLPNECIFSVLTLSPAMSGQELVLARLSSWSCGDGLLTADELTSKLFRLARWESISVKTELYLSYRAYKLQMQL